MLSKLKKIKLDKNKLTQAENYSSKLIKYKFIGKRVVHSFVINKPTIR